MYEVCNLSYAQTTDVTAVYVKKHEAVFADVYQDMWNQMAFIKDEQARVNAVNGYMVSFTKAIGMQELGAVTMDDSKADVEVSQFARPMGGSTKSTEMPTPAAPKPTYNGGGSNGGYGGEKKPYVPSGKPLEGDASDKQISTLEKFANGKNTEIKTIIFGQLAKWGKADISELTKQEASELINKAFAKVDEQKAKKAQQSDD